MRVTACLRTRITSKQLDPRWHDWRAVKALCSDCATLLLARGEALEPPLEQERAPDTDRERPARPGLGLNLDDED